MGNYRVAFASTDGIQIDQHFGTARYWQIYDLGQTAEYVEDRMTRTSCKGHCEGGFEDTLETLKDCQALFCIRIGPGAAEVCISRGVRVFEARGPIDKIAASIISNRLLDNDQEG